MPSVDSSAKICLSDSITSDRWAWSLGDNPGLPHNVKGENSGRTDALPGPARSRLSDACAWRARSHGSLTEEVGEPLGLVVMDDGHAGGVEGHKAQHDPVKHLGLHHVADRDAQKPFLVPEIGGPVHLCALDAGSGERCACGGEARRENEAAKTIALCGKGGNVGPPAGGHQAAGLGIPMIRRLHSRDPCFSSGHTQP